MSIAVVLHLREDELSQGEIVGEVEVVDSGEVRRVRGTAELIAFLQGLDRGRVRSMPDLAETSGDAPR